MAGEKKPWENQWAMEKQLGRGGQGTTFLVKSKTDPQRQGVLKVLNAGRSVQGAGVCGGKW